jgi:PAS domain S-box-containing protein
MENTKTEDNTSRENETLKEENTALKSRERTFLDSIEKYRMLVENMLDNVTILSTEGITIYENPSIQRISGYSPEELIGKSTFEFLHPDDIPEVQRVFMEVIESKGESRMVQYRFRHKNGTWRYMESTGKLYAPENSEPVVIVNSRDITEKRATEERIRKQDEIYQTILKNFPNGTVTLYDREFTYILSEGQELNKVGMSGEMLRGKNVYEIMPKDKAEFLVRYLEKSFDGNEYNFEITNGPKCYKLTTLPIYDENGEINLCLAITQNITEMKQAIEELRVTTEQLIETRQDLVYAEKLSALGRFSSHIAHEIRNPLANISASAQFLLKKSQDDPKLSVYIDVILRNTAVANSKIKEMLDFASPHEISLTEGSVIEVIENVIKLTSVRSAENNIKIQVVKKDEELPKVMINRKKLQEAIQNFIANSIDAMAEKTANGGEGKITVTLSAANGNVTIEIKDTGEGIPKEILDKILEPFYTTKITGTGLGMSLAHQIIQSHNGSMHIESEPGEGTTITVSLPAVSA